MPATIANAAIRPLHSGDAAAYLNFVRRLDPEDIRMRFGHQLRYDERCARRMLETGEAFAAFDRAGEIIGVARLVEAEIALIVRSDLKRRGIGRALLERLLNEAWQHGLTEISGHVLSENRPMLSLASRAGFRLAGSFGSQVELRLCLP